MRPLSLTLEHHVSILLLHARPTRAPPGSHRRRLPPHAESRARHRARQRWSMHRGTSSAPRPPQRQRPPRYAPPPPQRIWCRRTMRVGRCHRQRGSASAHQILNDRRGGGAQRHGIVRRPHKRGNQRRRLYHNRQRAGPKSGCQRANLRRGIPPKAIKVLRSAHQPRHGLGDVAMLQRKDSAVSRLGPGVSPHAL